MPNVKVSFLAGRDLLSRKMNALSRQAGRLRKALDMKGGLGGQRRDARGRFVAGGPSMTDLNQASYALTKIGRVTAAITAAPLKIGADFESEVSMLDAISGGALGAGDGLGRLREEARRLGATTEFTAANVMRSMQTMQRAGLSVDEQFASASAVLDFATISGETMDKSADLILGAAGAFGMGADQTSEAGNIITRVANATQASVSDIASSFRKAGVPARALGLDMAKTGEIMAVLGKSGVRGGEAGTATKAILSDLAALNQGRHAMALKIMGISKKDVIAALEDGEADGVFRLFGDKIAEKALKGTSAVNVLRGLVGKRHYDKLGLLIDATQVPEEHTQSWKRLAGTVHDTTKTLDKSAGIARDNTAGAMKALASAAEEVGIAVSEGILPTLKPVIDAFTKMTRAAGKFAEKYPSIVKGLLISTAAVSGLAFAFGGLLTVMVGAKALSAIGVIGGLGSALAALGVGGVLLASFGLGYALGQWLDKTYELSDALAGIRDHVNPDGDESFLGDLTVGERARTKELKTEAAGLQETIDAGGDTEFFNPLTTSAEEFVQAIAAKKRLQEITRELGHINARGRKRGKKKEGAAVETKEDAVGRQQASLKAAQEADREKKEKAAAELRQLVEGLNVGSKIEQRAKVDIHVTTDLMGNPTTTITPRADSLDLLGLMTEGA